MSAITGIFHANRAPIPVDHIDSLMKSLLQYPSDNINTWKNDNIFLGCHAQWITPESIGELLPYYDYERQLAITADAIIDNRDELFNMLQVNRELRKIIPDSQLILLAYYKWGEEAPKKLLGDFAFMIWDEKEHKLFGARDFSGARTLYYYRNDSRFAFSTTIEPLFTLPYVNKELNEQWLAEFIAIPTMVEAVDMFSTVYKSIQQIPPSHCITVKDGKVSLSRYCTVEVNETLRLNSNAEYEEAFRDVFQKSVKARVRTHGEVGSHLSGGLDSGSVVSFAAPVLKKENKRLHTFSYVPEGSFDDWTPNYYVANESPYIKETVNHVGNISDNYLSFDGKSPLSEVDNFLEIMEMPYKFFENAFWLKGINEHAQKNGVKVMLNGARGNHSISWGSMKLTYDYYTDMFKKLRWISLYNELDAYCTNYNTGKSVVAPFIVKRALRSLVTKKKQQHDYFPAFISPSLAEETNVFEKLKANGFSLNSNLTNLTEYRNNYYKQLFTWNKSGVAETKLSLRNGIWNRDPTNDLNVIRFCLALPNEQYVTGGMERSIIRRSMKGFLPDEVRLNQRKRGIQGADIVHRMKSDWNGFIYELHELSKDSKVNEFINGRIIKEALSNIGTEPKQELLFDANFKLLTRSLIVSRFIKRFR
ncbi:asparagine synthase-related protein [Virgibacillus salinus]|uniref:asparagine synthase (glutamine-hydrolyzing) n=1 Tax=Virgibacillus salinus TaxID=553311 RepID=A0A1H0Y538_9BACI|nr:asparagine synthase-related protein [Virgibacillus salinus]SDQ10191.1 asparagine synthase (glutamine-hydrolysing) [Virgibacillus salinus]